MDKKEQVMGTCPLLNMYMYTQGENNTVQPTQKIEVQLTFGPKIKFSGVCTDWDQPQPMSQHLQEDSTG